MPVDLDALVGEVLTPPLIDRLADAVGMDRRAARAFRDAGVPAALAALASLASTPEGARRVAAAVAEPDTLARLRAALDSGAVAPLDAAAAALGALIGPAVMRNLVDMLTRHADAPAEAARPALGAIGLAVLGVVGRQKASVGSDPGALGRLLASQQTAILGALPYDPAGVGEDVGAIATLEAAAAASAKLGPAPSAPASVSPRTAARRARMTAWLIVIAAALVAAGIGYYAWLSRHPRPAASALPLPVRRAQM